jgi:hypothetical protein
MEPTYTQKDIESFCVITASAQEQRFADLVLAAKAALKFAETKWFAGSRHEPTWVSDLRAALEKIQE